MTHAECGFKLCTVTKNSDDVYSTACLDRTPLHEHVRARTRPPYLSIKPYLDTTSFGNLLLLFIAITHAGCSLKLCSVNINSGDVPSPHKHVRARIPPAPVNQTLSRHDVIRQPTLTIYNDH